MAVRANDDDDRVERMRADPRKYFGEARTRAKVEAEQASKRENVLWRRAKLKGSAFGRFVLTPLISRRDKLRTRKTKR